MKTPEDRVILQMQAIEAALSVALRDAAGEDMGYVLLVVPVGRVGTHVLGTNIANKGVAGKFMHAAAEKLAMDWKKCELHVRKVLRKNLN